METLTTYAAQAANAPSVLLTGPALLGAADAAAAVARATLWPWIVEVCWSRAEGIGQRTITVVQAPMHAPPSAEDHVPADAQLLRADVFPATRFEDMTPHVRLNYRQHYRAFLTWRKAHALGKAVDALQPWDELDPVLIDENVERWAKADTRYSGG